MIKLRLPDFVVIGAAKCGTTSLAAYLDAHPGVLMARPKELRFFSHQWERGVDWYASRFDHASPSDILGEASPQYSQAPLVPDVPQRMASVIPEAKLVYMVRDPVDQMTSFYRHLVSKGREAERSFDVAVRSNSLYLAVASYGFQLERYLEHFGREQILVMDSARLRVNRKTALREILDFLGAEGDVPSVAQQTELNTAADKLFLPRYLTGPRAVWRKAQVVTGKIPKRWRRSLRARVSRPAPEAALHLGPDSAAWLRANLDNDLEQLKLHSSPNVAESISDWRDHLDTLVRPLRPTQVGEAGS